MKRSHQVTALAALAIALAAGLGGCATLRAELTPEALHRDATAGYIATATAIQLEEATGVSPARMGADELTRLQAWRVLLVERQLYFASGPHPLTALDAQADALRPAGQ